MEKRLDKIEEKVETILTNHLPHLAASIEKMSVDVSWIKQFFWIVATASIGSLIAAIIGLLIKK